MTGIKRYKVFMDFTYLSILKYLNNSVPPFVKIEVKISERKRI